MRASGGGRGGSPRAGAPLRLAVVALVVSACGGGATVGGIDAPSAVDADAAPGGVDTAVDGTGGSGAIDASAIDTGTPTGGVAGSAGRGGVGGVAGAGGPAGAMGGNGTAGGAGARGGGPAGSGGADAGGRGGAVADAGTRDTAPDAVADVGKACAVCAAWGSPVMAGRVTASGLDNLSGMAASSRNPGVLYVHNDMTRQQFFAVSEGGALLGTYSWTGTTVEDLEDMAVAHCPAGSCVYLADIGGNLAARTTFAILRAPEPTVTVGQAAVTASVTVERLAFSYEDGMHNAESLLVDPGSDNLYIVTKPESGPAAVYRVAGTFGQAAVVARKVADLPVPKSTDRQTSAASAHPCGAGFLLRTYNTLYEFRIAPGAPFESAFAAAPVIVPAATESQGEAVTYSSDGRRTFTTGEGSMPALNRVDCTQ